MLIPIIIAGRQVVLGQNSATRSAWLWYHIATFYFRSGNRGRKGGVWIAFFFGTWARGGRFGFEINKLAECRLDRRTSKIQDENAYIQGARITRNYNSLKANCMSPRPASDRLLPRASRMGSGSSIRTREATSLKLQVPRPNSAGISEGESKADNRRGGKRLKMWCSRGQTWKYGCLIYWLSRKVDLDSPLPQRRMRASKIGYL